MAAFFSDLIFVFFILGSLWAIGMEVQKLSQQWFSIEDRLSSQFNKVESLLFSCLLGLSTLMSCEQDAVETSNQSTLSGSAVKGYVDGAKVNVYEYLAKGERGSLIASANIDNKGSFSISTDYRGPVEIVVTQGQYADEATGTKVSLQAKELRSIALLKQESQVAVSALTTIAAEYVNANATASIETSIEEANKKIAEAFGIAEVNISRELPADLSHASNALSQAQAQYGAVQAGLSQIVKEHNLSAEELLILVADIAKDFTDGVLDGKAGSTALETTLTLTPDQALNGLNIAIENFLRSERNQSGYFYESIGITVPKPAGR